MKRELQVTQFLPLERPAVFAFFSDPANLARITPPSMGFRMVTPTPLEIETGTVIDYRVRVFGVSIRWRSLIDQWDPPRQFVDVQLAGPYKQWIHTHRFLEQPDGTLIEDHVQYQLPLQPIGDLAHWAVRRQLEHIFAFRRESIERILLPTGGQTASGS